jgi:ABC-type branched-subunit amino acid transport system ATPase component
MSMINLRSLGVTLHAPLFSNLNLSIAAGDRLGVVAANGRGKSTLLRCIAGTVEPTSGDITRARGLRVGLLEQDVPRGFGELTLHEAVRQALPPGQAESEGWRVDVALESLNVPAALRERALDALSGGWERIAMLARAWVAEPDVLLLDEPSLGLAPLVVSRIFEVIRELNREGATILLVEQNARMALRVAHRGYVIQTGRIVLTGTGSELIRSDVVRKTYLGEK